LLEKRGLVTLKPSIFVCRFLNNCLSTKDNLEHRNFFNSNMMYLSVECGVVD
jgi:hypothetical protein